ncbi:MAG: hypothetical protein IKH28_03050 [Lachnospiraceae bacterium]|nr:hypothetical protein [Lachnospiraceae bacterium]
MNPYPNYYPQTYNAFQQNYAVPNYGHPGILTKMVDDFGYITANDVPMDGNGAIFIKKDGSEIQRRVWTAQGNIIVTSYLPQIANKGDLAVSLSSETEKSNLGAFNEFAEAFNEKMKSLNDKIDKIYDLWNGGKTE